MTVSEKGTQPLLSRAAHTIAESVGLADTMIDVLRARAFQPYAEGLRQYLVIRLGSEDEGAQAYLELRAAVAGLGKLELFDPPGIRARLYGLARELVEQHWEGGGGVAGGAAVLPWRSPGFGISQRYRSDLDKLRRELPASEAELLELRFSRELEPEEIAYVLEEDPERIEVQLTMAIKQVRSLLGGEWSEPETGIDTLLLEAFALEYKATGDDGQSVATRKPLETGTVIGERYEIQGQMGSGGMGNVYRASDTEVPGHVVALKLLHEPAHSVAAREASLRELRLIASVFHPSVVQFKDHGWYKGRLWFVMPLYEGESLEDRLGRRPLARAEARPIFEQLALALAAMHAAGIRHQDIKPDNIFLAEIKGLSVEGMVGTDGSTQVLPVLLDLGVAAKEAELVLAGTPIYFAPEVAAQYARVEEPHPVTAAADVFSLCLSLRNALEPSSREDVAAGAVERFIEHRAAKSPRPPHSRDLRFLKSCFERWLDLDPEHRPAADELAKELSVLTAPEERRARRMRFARWFGPLAIALVAIFGAVVYGLNRRAELQQAETARARLEAESAQLEVVGMQVDLSQAAEREKSLEQDVAQTLDRYRSSEMTREELTNKLARAEGESRMLRGMVSDEKRRSGYFKTELDNSVEENSTLTKELTGVRGELGTQRAKVAKLNRSNESLGERLTKARAEAAEAMLRADTLDERVSALQGQLDLEAGASRRLEQELADMRQVRDTAQTALARANRRIEQLERRLAAQKRSTKTTIPRPEGGPNLRERPPTPSPPSEQESHPSGGD